ncbi:MAG TPA: trimethylamine methyltransferase family protein [Anaerolineales bacterium]|nr:trimethylamine methyltransferase family protein [Anaerolineales bacterium]
MQPMLRLLSEDMVQQVLDEAFSLLENTGILVQSPAARQLLAENGAILSGDVARLPQGLVLDALVSAPHEFFLYNHHAEIVVRYGGDTVQFDPGSSGVNIFDPHTCQHRPAVTADLVQLIQVTEMLPEYAAQSTSVVCSDVPKEIGDLYRLYLVLLYGSKPVITGAFNRQNTQAMIDMLALYAGGREALRKRPLAVFDVCPTPPLIFSPFAAESLIDLAQAGIPAELISMPLAGAGSPVTILGSIVQHAAETLAGITLHQLAGPGAPVVWGGAPAVFDMRFGTTPMGAIETAMLDVGYAQVGKSLNLPTHTYLGASDSKLVDYQAGLESGISAILGALGGINMISGAGMLDFLAAQCVEKLVADAEAIRMAQRLLRGIQPLTETYALELFAGINFKADFLKQKATRQLFSKEQSLPSAVIDRGSLRAWDENGRSETVERAGKRAAELLAAYRRPEAPAGVEAELRQLVGGLARQSGMDRLPELPDPD